jgi:hypothetical protein
MARECGRNSTHEAGKFPTQFLPKQKFLNKSRNDVPILGKNESKNKLPLKNFVIVFISYVPAIPPHPENSIKTQPRRNKPSVNATKKELIYLCIANCR